MSGRDEIKRRLFAALALPGCSESVWPCGDVCEPHGVKTASSTAFSRDCECLPPREATPQ